MFHNRQASLLPRWEQELVAFPVLPAGALHLDDMREIEGSI
jgi:hypothetical protein